MAEASNDLADGVVVRGIIYSATIARQDSGRLDRWQPPPEKYYVGGQKRGSLWVRVRNPIVEYNGHHVGPRAPL